ncbi:hypothetical protein [Amycolatopsis alkalitolerans]|uniref:Uncharacterized protein n=1 Tax=Amycolatopsis alkalitolerans TaxID=2547244 RepID=A0A5C4LW68_9PSEU|nr:hypothetical protein [Amycolatopsis alkalitolerans]TNC23682.1 hypothetical protein FG385_20120 [Amycolatopsis alkalitolerans]
MRTSIRAGLIVGALLTAVLGAGCTPAPSTATTQVPSVSLPAPKTPPPPAATLVPAAAVGEVRVEPGPFTDRVRLTGLRLDAAASTVQGHLAITSDISDVLALDVHAAFYDAQGRLLGTGTFHYEEEEPTGGATHTGPRAVTSGIDVAVAAAPAVADATAVVVSIPVLVNE